MNITRILETHHITLVKEKDQFLLRDNTIVEQMITYACLNTHDVILEVGAGTGVLTRMLAAKAGKVISFEIDEQFRSVLSDLPENVEMHIENAWEYVKLHGKQWKRKPYNKVVANLPYSFVEPFLHTLTFLLFDTVILMVPFKMVRSIQENDVFSSFFQVHLKTIVPKEKFYPTPRTNSAIIELIHIPDTIKTKNLGFFLRQYIYQHEDQKTKNSLQEGIIAFAHDALQKTITKKQARKMIEASGIDNSLLENTPNTRDIYFQISDKLDTETLLRLYVGGI